MKTPHNILIGARRRYSPQDIMLLTADINYTKVYFANGCKITVATSLKILEKRFETCNDFFRTHICAGVFKCQTGGRLLENGL